MTYNLRLTPTWLEISKDALQNNVTQIKKNLPPQTKFIAVVKANAYGHGLMEVVSSVKNKVDYFAVYAFEDALFLRKKNITRPILVLGKTFPSQISLAIKHQIEITVSTFDILAAAKKISGKKKLMIHICADTGLGRDGFISSDVKKILPLLQNTNLEVKGLYAHFACADDSSFDSYTKKQISELLRWKKSFAEIGLQPLLHHAASAATITSQAVDLDMVRVGISLYGLWPSKEIETKHKNKIKLIPALSWKTRIAEIKFLPKGSAISYNCTHILKRDSKLAVLPIGYFDGIARVSSNKSFAIVGGKKVPQIGRVTMNLIVLDVTDVADVKEGDVVEIIGKKITADDWASWSQSSNYEVVTRINSVVRRVVV
jgi:alanine racemase